MSNACSEVLQIAMNCQDYDIWVCRGQEHRGLCKVHKNVHGHSMQRILFD